MSSFDIRRLRYFVTVAELGSVTRAAAELHVAQPALSHQIHQLEEELQVQLFARGPQGMTLTEAGRELADSSRVILSDIKALKHRLKDRLHGDPEGLVVIGIAQTISLAIAAPMVSRAVRELPRVDLQVREVMSSEIPALIRSHALDFAISYAIPSSYGITSTEIFSEDLFLFGHRLAAAKRLGKQAGNAQVPFAALEGLPLYLSAKSNGVRDELERIAKLHKVKLTVAAEVDSVTLRKELALEGDAFTILSGAAIRKEMSDPGVYAACIVEPALRRKVCFVRKNGEALSRAAHRLAAVVADTLDSAATSNAWPGTIRLHDLRSQW